MMNYQNIFGIVNRDLSILCPILQEKYRGALEECNETGYHCEIFEGYRTPFRQAALYAQSRTAAGKWATDAQPWDSFHQYGLAFDIAFKIKGRWTWDASMPWEKCAGILMDHGLEWPKPKGEVGHFQISAGLSLSEIKQIARDQGIPALWLVIAAELKK